MRQGNAALRFLRANAARFGGDPARIVLGGDPAGAQIASQLAAVETGTSMARSLGLTPALPSGDLRGVVLFCGRAADDVVLERDRRRDHMPIPAGSRYVAMGSSFAAGPGLPARVPGSPRSTADAGWDYVAVSAASADHHAWSAEPWTRRFHLSLRGGAPYHPNAAGMAAVAGLVLAELAQNC